MKRALQTPQVWCLSGSYWKRFASSKHSKPSKFTKKYKDITTISRHFKVQSSALPYQSRFIARPIQLHLHLYQRGITYTWLNCKSKNLTYFIECKKCGKQYIGETKRHLHKRFDENSRSIFDYSHFSNSTPVFEHFNQADHSINDVDVLLILLELIRSNCDSVRKAREAHLIDKAMTLEPCGINRH